MSDLKSFRGRIPSALDAVDTLCARLRRGELAAIPENELFAVELLLREALTNAVIHAGTSDLWCEIELFDQGVVVRVQDDGNGFDWRRSLRAAVQGANESGRGVPILRSYSSALRFNEKGNSVEAIRVFRKRSQ